LTASGPFSKVYRASIGPYTIAMKELAAGCVPQDLFIALKTFSPNICYSKTARDEADYAKVVAPRVSVKYVSVSFRNLP